MREILFRGKRTDNGEWIYGYPYQLGGLDTGVWCITERPIPLPAITRRVNPGTISQFTGLTDKNGKRIFEGDVVAYIEYGNFAVVWDDGAFQLMREDTFYYMLDHYTNENTVVVGNIHDTPELLEVKE